MLALRTVTSEKKFALRIVKIFLTDDVVPYFKFSHIKLEIRVSVCLAMQTLSRCLASPAARQRLRAKRGTQPARGMDDMIHHVNDIHILYRYSGRSEKGVLIKG